MLKKFLAEKISEQKNFYNKFTKQILSSKELSFVEKQISRILRKKLQVRSKFFENQSFERNCNKKRSKNNFDTKLVKINAEKLQTEEVGEVKFLL